MNRKKYIIGLLLMVVILIAGGVWVYKWAFGVTQAPSGTFTAVPIQAGPTSPVAIQTTQSGDSQAYPAPGAKSNPTQPEPYPGAGAERQPEAGQVLFQIAQDQSQARFIIFEELNGQPKDVIGVTNQLAGEVAVNLADLSSAQIGPIKVNARALATDDDRRNQAIRNRILHTDAYEFITFTPTSIQGLSGSASPGQKFDFQIAGNLTIQDVTQAVVFAVSGQVESLERLSGVASTTIQRTDFNLNIPSVPFVANVGQEVKLEIDLVLLPLS